MLLLNLILIVVIFFVFNCESHFVDFPMDAKDRLRLFSFTWFVPENCTCPDTRTQASAFGFATNLVSIITIKKCVNLQASFGILCACLAANNSALLVLNSSWYMLPDSGIFKAGSIISRIVGLFALLLWIVGIRIHLLISVNRFIAIVSPIKKKKYVTVKSTIIAVGIIVFVTFLQCSPLIIVDGFWFCYDRRTMQWVFSRTELAKFYEQHINYLSNAIEISLVFILDVITLVNLRLAHSQKLVNINATSATTRAIEAFSQSIPLMVTLAFFGYVTPVLTDDFEKFLTTTFVWHVAHGVDGLIIDLFHTRLDLFVKRSDNTRSIADSSSFAPTTVV